MACMLLPLSACPRVLLPPAAAVRHHQERSEESGNAVPVTRASKLARQLPHQPGAARGEGSRAVSHDWNGKVGWDSVLHDSVRYYKV